MQCAPVRCAVRAIAEAVGQLPFHIYRRNEDGSKERAPDHPAYALLHDRANAWTSAAKLREDTTQDALLHENGGFAYINRVDGKPVELLWLNAARMTVATDAVTGEPIYKYDAGQGTARIYSRNDILHIPSPSLNGSGLVRDGREAIRLAMVMEQHAARLFGRGARPAGILKFPNKLGAEVAARIKAAWQSAHGGSNSGGTAVLEEGGDFTPLTMNSVDAQFLELRKFQIEEIARIFRVPPVFLMEYGRATWSNSEEMGRQFLTYSLLPWLKRWEGEIALKLFSEGERETYFAEFLTDDLLRADFDTRMDGYAKAISARILNPNEARSAENRPPYEGGDKFENPNTSAGAANG
jgi:HK97 family phage portal protein